ncbi:unnamed protein product [Schistosoma turkestanicum]|nr:unnamed protein product [Schistosoma turkestanicum]
MSTVSTGYKHSIISNQSSDTYTQIELQCPKILFPDDNGFTTPTTPTTTTTTTTATTAATTTTNDKKEVSYDKLALAGIARRGAIVDVGTIMNRLTDSSS